MTQATELRELASLLKVDSGNVGIGLGTDTPDQPLHIKGTRPIRIERAGVGEFEISIDNTVTGDSLDFVIEPVSGSVSAGFQVRTRQTDGTLLSSLSVNHDGKVGIGTIGPQNSLHVNSSTDQATIRLTSADNSFARIYFGDQSDGVRGRVEYDNNDDALIFGTNNVQEHVRIDAIGNVGIGTDAPTEKLEVSGTAKAEQYLIDAIAKDISDTAVDVFVYDTRKDSDGGAWRHRTQNTSWYNETLNTSTRGARKEFPSVAVITLVSGSITIYDGDDPDMPMWMKFTQSSSQSFTNGGQASYVVGGCGFATTSGINMLNGTLTVPHHGGCSANDTREGILVLNFLSEVGEWITYTTSANFEFAGPISNRNTSMPLSLKGSTRSIVNTQVNDVDMTVLPNAPIDADTGLPVPTIAVATDGGVSVIKDDGNVIDYVGSGSYNVATLVNFTKDHRIRFALEASAGRYYRTYDIGSVDRSVNTWDFTQDDGLTLYVNYANGDAVMLGNPIVDATEKAVCTGKGVTFFEENLTTANESLVAHATSSYNTGWMHGDIKLVTLSDTDTTNVTGSELVDQTASGWTLPTGFSHNGSGTLTAASNTGQYQKAYDVVSLVIGKTYTVTYNVTAMSGSMSFWIANSSSYSTNFSYENPISGLGVKSFTFTPTQTSMHLVFQCNALGNTITVEDISVRLAEEDRSVNNNGLQVFGTVTKSAVATGAELVGYSGFTTGNYLLQPYNAALNFTNEFSISFWVKNWSASQDLLHRGPGQTRNSKTSFHMYCDGGYDYRLTLTSNGSTEQTFEIPLSGNLTGWQNVCFTLTPGGAVRGYLNGHLEFTGAFTGTNIFTQATDQNGLYIGDGPVSAAFGGSLALLRLSATAPSAEQIKKMYNDEKFLFQENTKCTLYGTSDAVTALAYDDDTELLHAGTSEGRSVFQGLRRVDNTTDAVGAAISASNGLVAED